MAEKVTAVHDMLGDFAPKFAGPNDDVPFGDVCSREEQLSVRNRSIVTVSALVTSGVLDSPLQHHIERTKNNGVTAKEMAELLTHAAFDAGWPKAWATFRIAKSIYAANPYLRANVVADLRVVRPDSRADPVASSSVDLCQVRYRSRIRRRPNPIGHDRWRNPSGWTPSPTTGPVRHIRRSWWSE